MSEQLRIVARLDSVAEKVRRVTKLVREVDADILQATRNIIWRAGLRRNSWQECRSFLTQRKPDVSVQSETEYQFAGVYSFGRGVFKADRKLGSTFKYSQLSRISAGDFIFPKLMAWEGALGVVPPECDGMVVSPEFPVFEIDTKVVSPDIVDTFFRDPRALPMLKDASTGTNMRRRRIQPSRFLELKMPIPSAGEQRLVRALLERRQLVIDRHEPNLGLLDRILPSMLHEAFAA
jgi:type I restriction enzyme S subunit